MEIAGAPRPEVTGALATRTDDAETLAEGAATGAKGGLAPTFTGGDVLNFAFFPLPLPLPILDIFSLPLPLLLGSLLERSGCPQGLH